MEKERSHHAATPIPGEKGKRRGKSGGISFIFLRYYSVKRRKSGKKEKKAILFGEEEPKNEKKEGKKEARPDGVNIRTFLWTA